MKLFTKGLKLILVELFPMQKRREIRYINKFVYSYIKNTDRGFKGPGFVKYLTRFSMHDIFFTMFCSFCFDKCLKNADFEYMTVLCSR